MRLIVLLAALTAACTEPEPRFRATVYTMIGPRIDSVVTEIHGNPPQTATLVYPITSCDTVYAPAAAEIVFRVYAPLGTYVQALAWRADSFPNLQLGAAASPDGFYALVSMRYMGPCQ